MPLLHLTFGKDEPPGHDHGEPGYAHPHDPPPVTAESHGPHDDPDHRDGMGHFHGMLWHVHREPGSAAGVHRARERRRLLVCIVITAAMMVVELVGGLLTGSLALVSDAGHMLTHAGALLVSLVAMRIAARPSPPERSFGYFRAEVLAALFNGVTLVLITAYIVYEAVHRLVRPQPILGLQMLAIAGVGLAVNLLTAAILHGVSREDLNTRSAFLHMVGDALSSVAVIGGAVAITVTGWTIIDPILSLLICGVILRWSWHLLSESIHILLESAPRGLDVARLRATLESACGPGCHVRRLHVWAITSGMAVLSAHVEVPAVRAGEANALLDAAKARLLSEHGIRHSTIQIRLRRDTAVAEG